MRIAVIGGGWSGIAAAVELVERGASVTLIEAGRVLGGRARTVMLDGHALDNGQHILLGAYRETLALMRRVGADPDALFERRPLQVIDNTGFRLSLPKIPAPFNVAWGLMNAAAVNLPEKLKTALWMQGVKARNFRLPEDCTVAAWLDAAGQTGKLRRHLWEPLCLAALNTPAERASAQLFANVLRDSLGSPRQADTDLLLPKVPLGELLPEPAAIWLKNRKATLRFGQRVRTVAPASHGVAIDGEIFDGAVLTVAPQHLAGLFPQAGALREFEPIATIYLQYAANVALPFPLLSLLGNQGQWVVDRSNGLIAAVLSGKGNWEKLDDVSLARTVAQEIAEAWLPGVRPAWQRVIREKRATFSCRPGLTRPHASTDFANLVLAGDHSWHDYPATLEGAVRSGLRAARLLAGNSQ